MNSYYISHNFNHKKIKKLILSDSLKEMDDISACETTINDNGEEVIIDPITAEEIPRDRVRVLREGQSVYCLDLDTLYRNYLATGRMDNPYTKNKLPKRIRDDVREYSKSISIAVNVDGVKIFEIDPSVQIGDLIIRLHTILSDERLYIKRDLILDDGEYETSLLDFDLKDSIDNIAENREINLKVLPRYLDSSVARKFIEWSALKYNEANVFILRNKLSGITQLPVKNPTIEAYFPSDDYSDDMIIIYDYIKYLEKFGDPTDDKLIDDLIEACNRDIEKDRIEYNKKSAEGNQIRRQYWSMDPTRSRERLQTKMIKIHWGIISLPFTIANKTRDLLALKKYRNMIESYSTPDHFMSEVLTGRGFYYEDSEIYDNFETKAEKLIEEVPLQFSTGRYSSKHLLRRGDDVMSELIAEEIPDVKDAIITLYKEDDSYRFSIDNSDKVIELEPKDAIAALTKILMKGFDPI